MNNHRSVATRGRTFSFVAGAFAAGLAVSLIAFHWLMPAGPVFEEPVASEPLLQDAVASLEVPAPAKRPVIVDNSVHSKQLPPNPFARTAAGLPRATPQPVRQPYIAPVASTYSYGDYGEAAPVDPKLTLAWAKRIKAWCAQWTERDRPRCASLSLAMERILAENEGAQDIWSQDMEEQLSTLLETIGSRDFSYREVNCTSAGCVVYWQTENYARPGAAGNVLVDALVKRGWLSRDESPGQRRVAGFNPTNSIAWEALVLERTE